MAADSPHPRRSITIGFLIGGGVNVFGSLLVSAGFTNTLLRSTDPVVFSNFGIIAIMLWGLAYVSVSRAYPQVPYLLLVFTVEKLVYTVAWIVWLMRYGDTLPALFSQSFLTATFFATYGVVDFAFGVFFASVSILTFRQRPADRG
jgi:hypothetical protein